jgi:hypothetical protein
MRASAVHFSLPFILLSCLVSFQSRAYSILAHEAVIDASWETAIVPLLKIKYPQATATELKIAHSYAYGGAIVPDMGYYPFGNTYFTDLLHYVRSGDFVVNLIGEARNINEYAFALGALSHYMTDKYGHSLSTNLAVPIVYPKIGKKFGSIVTYDEDKTSHKRMEFAFDVLQTARGNYASTAYHDFIGFNVSIAPLQRAFLQTYGQDLNDVFPNISLTVATFRWAVSSLMPGLTKTAWVLKKNEIQKTNPASASSSFHYKLKRREYYQEFGRQHEQPSFGNRVLALIIRILAKVGPLKSLKFKAPGPEGEKLFNSGFDTVLVYYNNAVKKLDANSLHLVNIDFDTGNQTQMGEYGLTDKTYGELVVKLQEKNYTGLTSELKHNIVSFYNTSDTTGFAKKNAKDWSKTYVALRQIKQAAPILPGSLNTITGPTYRLIEDTTYHHQMLTLPKQAVSNR